MNIGETIKEIAAAKKVPATKLASAIGRTRQKVYDIYKGKTSPRVDELIKIADVLNTPVGIFFKDSPMEYKIDDVIILRNEIETLKVNVQDLKTAGAYILKLLIKDAENIL